ncbi:MAG: XkdX family protein [Alkaliphilus sp.]|nr:XkdX family protein [Alkaliphilus sp.]
MFNNLKSRYEKGWVRVDQLQRYVKLKIITAEEFRLICNMEYEA